ncbi:MAG: hypothetical protein LIP16_00470, partial [Clostridium sp.]|nr:hypothetical protein [Clostridium sp.]
NPLQPPPPARVLQDTGGIFFASNISRFYPPPPSKVSSFSDVKDAFFVGFILYNAQDSFKKQKKMYVFL